MGEVRQAIGPVDVLARIVVMLVGADGAAVLQEHRPQDLLRLGE